MHEYWKAYLDCLQWCWTTSSKHDPDFSVISECIRSVDGQDPARIDKLIIPALTTSERYQAMQGFFQYILLRYILRILRGLPHPQTNWPWEPHDVLPVSSPGLICLQQVGCSDWYIYIYIYIFIYTEIFQYIHIYVCVRVFIHMVTTKKGRNMVS